MMMTAMMIRTATVTPTAKTIVVPRSDTDKTSKPVNSKLLTHNDHTCALSV